MREINTGLDSPAASFHADEATPRWKVIRLVRLVAILLAINVCLGAASEVAENKFVFAQVRYSGEWDPYPLAWDQIRSALEQTTSVETWPARRVLTWQDPELYESPFLVMAGRGALGFTEADKQRIRNYLIGGGFLFVDNTEAERQSPMARSVLPLLGDLFAGTSWQSVPSDHAVFRSFFLLRRAGGRKMAEQELKGLWIQDRLAVIYCGNDLLGTLARDPLGNFLYPCEPGGELQRAESTKLLINLIMFGLTGTYKTDAIHQPFIERKLQ